MTHYTYVMVKWLIVLRRPIKFLAELGRLCLHFLLLINIIYATRPVALVATAPYIFIIVILSSFQRCSLLPLRVPRSSLQINGECRLFRPTSIRLFHVVWGISSYSHFQGFYLASWESISAMVRLISHGQVFLKCHHQEIGIKGKHGNIPCLE